MAKNASYPPQKLSSRPLYDQAIEALEIIIAHDYQPGDKLPSEEELAKQLGISRGTMRQALGNLESEGVIARRHGAGTFVTAMAKGHVRRGMELVEGFRSLAANAGVAQERTAWSVDSVTATDELAEELQVERGAPLVRVQLIANINRTPFAYLDSYISTSYVAADELRGYQEGTLIDYLAEQGRVKLSHTNTDIFPVVAEQEIAARLGVPVGKPLLHLQETFFIENGQPIFRSLNYYAPDSMNFHIIRRVIQR